MQDCNYFEFTFCNRCAIFYKKDKISGFSRQRQENYSMNTTAKSMRLTFGIFGRTNAGKSSLVNYITNQAVAITSEIAGTTTDTVEKTMELAPAGPVVFIDTAGLDDASDLGGERIKKTLKVFERADIAILVTTPGVWGDTEIKVAEMCSKRKIKLIAVVNKCDTAAVEVSFLENIRRYTENILQCSALDPAGREEFMEQFKKAVAANLPESFTKPIPLLGDLVKPGDLIIMIVPIDLQAPKGRLILPQVQAIRDALDNNAMILAVKEDRYAELIGNINPRPALVICDSQVVKMMIQTTPSGIPCTTFSVLFSRLKGDTSVFMQGCKAIDSLQDGDRVLIAEACTHHPTCEDIGRVKIPMLLQKKTGKKLQFDFAPGRDFPENITQYKLIVHCGSCMLNRHETLDRVYRAQSAGIPIANYGMTISYCQGVLDKVLIPE